MQRYGLGLRTQILVALSLAFVVSFTLLGVVVVRLVQRDEGFEDQRRAEAMAGALAVGIGLGDARPVALDMSRLNADQGVRGLSIARPWGTTSVLGRTEGAPDGVVTLSEGTRVALWLRPRDPDRTAPLSNLLRLYLFVTGAAILLVAYVLLTRLIVRPVEVLTRASERLARVARGSVSGNVPVQGAAEVVRLAVSFNRMGHELAEERRQLEERLAELERTTQELREAQDHIIRSEKLASVGRLAAGVAHEIGNPLAAILGFVELLRGGGLDEATQDEFLARVQRETERIHGIIGDLLDYSRSELSEQESAARCDLAEVVSDAVKLVAPQKDLRDVTIEQRMPVGSLWVRAPAHSITQVVLNLLLNAADAVEGRGEILIEIEREGDELCLSVTDSGKGIADEVRATLFDPFVTTKPAGQGTGLGLSVCQSIVERFEGRIGVENVALGGARFCVCLKAA